MPHGENDSSENHSTSPERRRSRFRHEFRPGKLIIGLVMAGTAGAYLGDAAGAWQTPSYVALPAVCFGLLLAGAATWVSYGLRRRAARAASTDSTDAPASSSGSHAIR
ncbi:hypothetical protein [Streptomyces sp. ISL-98]|uniref:hypothetical protein n=1 Tax=Streptomyces sp. ISL-98 TaxID=2819192 RepID=UPI0027E4D34F|nr:hypothetical protein [Streptomyces sp. ISL-98]